MRSEKILKKTYSKNGHEIILVESVPKDYLKTVLIVGVVHGDEPQGKFLINNYVAHFSNIYFN